MNRPEVASSNQIQLGRRILCSGENGVGWFSITGKKIAARRTLVLPTVLVRTNCADVSRLVGGYVGIRTSLIHAGAQ